MMSLTCSATRRWYSGRVRSPVGYSPGKSIEIVEGISAVNHHFSRRIKGNRSFVIFQRAKLRDPPERAANSLRKTRRKDYGKLRIAVVVHKVVLYGVDNESGHGIGVGFVYEILFMGLDGTYADPKLLGDFLV